MKYLITIILFSVTFLNAVVVTDYQMDECYWLDNAGGVIDDVKDNTVNQLDGTSHGNAQTFEILNGGTHSPCYAGRFDGNLDFVDTANNALLNTGNNFSIANWIYLNNTSNTFEIMAHKTTNYTNGFTWYINRSGNTNYLILLIGNGAQRQLVFRTVSELQWFHAAATYNGSIMRLYVNGIQVATRNYGNGIANVNVPLVIGKGLGNSFSFNGDLDEVKIFNHTLSAAEVNDMYTNESAGNNFDGSPRTCPTCDTSAIAGVWGLVGVPADFRTAVSKDVSDVFDEFPVVDYNVPANPNGWVIFRRVYSGVDNNSSYEIVPYNGSALEFGQGYWLASNANRNWSENGIVGVDYNSSNPNCTANSCVEIDLTSVIKNFGAPDNDVNDGTGGNRNNMLGFIGTVPVDWADCRILVDGTVYTPSAADTAGFVDNQVWQYNPGAGSGANANGYTTCNDTTPGGCKLEPYKGFWLILHGITKNKTVKLLIPKE